MSLSQILLLTFAAIFVGVVAFNFRRIRGGVRRLRGFAEEVRQELRRVSWPTRAEVIDSTVLVGVSTLVMVFLIGGADWFFGRMVGWLFDFN